MRHLTITVAALAAVASNIARADAPPECAAVPMPPLAQRSAAARAYAPGMALAGKGRHAEAVRALAAAWSRVRRDLARAFAREDCKPDAIQAVVGKAVRASPPLAVPGDDRFLPPPVVTWTAASAACSAGDLAGALSWLLPAGLAGDADALAAAAVLLAASGHAGRGLALLPERPSSLASRAARALLSRRLGLGGEEFSVPDGTAPSPVAAGVLSLLRGAASGPAATEEERR